MLLPRDLLVNNDQPLTVDWQPWATGASGAHTAVGHAGPLELAATVTLDHVLRADVELLNVGEEPTELRRCAWVFEVDQPEEIYLSDSIRTAQPWDFNITRNTLASFAGVLSPELRYDGQTLVLHSADVATYRDGFVRAEPLDMKSGRLKLAWHRVEPKWDYNGLVSMRPLNGLWIHEGQTRLMTICVLVDPSADKPVDYRAPVTQPDRDTANVPLLIRSGRQTHARDPWDESVMRMAADGEYAGLFGGGFDFRNGVVLEPHVCRAEYGEFLLHEHLRTGDEHYWRLAVDFAAAFERVCVNRSEHPERGGAVRGRYGDNMTAHQIRSMRGAAFFWDMAALTGIDRYRHTARGIADYLARSFPWTNARQGAAVRDLFYLHTVTGEARYLEACRLIVDTLARAQTADGGWYEYWNDKFEAYEYDPPSHHGGEWTPRSTQKPEMASYNVNGLLDALRLDHDGLLPADTRNMVHRAAEWLLTVQHASGAWPFPSPDSTGLYGYGVMLDAAAMLKAGDVFDDQRYVDAGKRAIQWSYDQVAQHDFVPQLVGVRDVDQVECSLTAFYAYEAVACAEAADQ